MLHLRIIVPADLTPSVERLLLHEPGAVHLTVVPGAGRDPEGDLIEVDVERAALRAILSRLEDLHVPDRGSLSFVELGDVRSRAADAAEAAEARAGDGPDRRVHRCGLCRGRSRPDSPRPGPRPGRLPRRGPDPSPT